MICQQLRRVGFSNLDDNHRILLDRNPFQPNHQAAAVTETLLQHHGVPTMMSTSKNYNAMRRRCSKSSRERSCGAEKMRSSGTVRLQTIPQVALCRSLDVDPASQVLEEMASNPVSPVGYGIKLCEVAATNPLHQISS